MTGPNVEWLKKAKDAIAYHQDLNRGLYLESRSVRTSEGKLVEEWKPITVTYNIERLRTFDVIRILCLLGGKGERLRKKIVTKLTVPENYVVIFSWFVVPIQGKVVHSVFAAPLKHK